MSRDVRELIARFDARGGKRVSRLAAEVESIVDDRIDTVLFANKRGSAEDVHKATELAIGKANGERSSSRAVESTWLPDDTAPYRKSLSVRVGRGAARCDCSRFTNSIAWLFAVRESVFSINSMAKAFTGRCLVGGRDSQRGKDMQQPRVGRCGFRRRFHCTLRARRQIRIEAV